MGEKKNENTTNEIISSENKTEDTAEALITDTSSDKKEKKVRFARLKRFQEKRMQNSEKYGKLNNVLLLIFPLFILAMAEITQSKGFSFFADLWIHHTGAIIFGLIITVVVYVFLLAIFNRGWAAVAVQGVLFMALATTERFKYNTNGNHLILSDMRIAKSVKSLTSFAYIKITPGLIAEYIVVIAFIFLVYYLNPKIKIKLVPRVTAIALCILPGFGLVMIPSFYKPVYSFFNVDTTEATNDFLLKEKFNNNGFFTFLVQTASETYANRLKTPDNYSQEAIDNILRVNVNSDGDFNGGKKPNVIVVMSESNADFRVFDQLDINKDIYKYFDEACNDNEKKNGKTVSKSTSGRIITPTYASWTVRAEFELMFGLPVRSLNDPNMPQRILAAHDLPAMAQYYNSWGYNTAYVHPFQANFYGRNKIYKRFGFQNMIFHDDYDKVTDFTVDVEHYGNYVDDNTVFEQLVELVKDSDEPVYIHTTTMQNHQPYNLGEDPNAEFDNYLQWIQHSYEGLHTMLEELKKVDEPTLVFFVGDHFPSLRGETSVYNELDMTGENCNILYEQTYFLWANYDADFSKIPDEKFSFFYVPYVLIDVIDAPHDSFIEKMMNYMKSVPIYSTSYDPDSARIEDLDILAYDRAVGDLYSESPITNKGD